MSTRSAASSSSCSPARRPSRAGHLPKASSAAPPSRRRSSAQPLPSSAPYGTRSSNGRSPPIPTTATRQRASSEPLRSQLRRPPTRRERRSPRHPKRVRPSTRRLSRLSFHTQALNDQTQPGVPELGVATNIVVSEDSNCVYRCAYSFVSATRCLLQLVARLGRHRCSSFRHGILQL